MMKLVHNDVVERIRREVPQMREPAQGLDRSKQHIGVRILLSTGLEAERGIRPNVPKGPEGLGQDLIAMSHE